MSASLAVRSLFALGLAALLAPLPAPAAQAVQNGSVAGAIRVDSTLPAGTKLNCGAIALIINDETLSRSLNTPQGTVSEDTSGGNPGGCRFVLPVVAGTIQLQPQSISMTVPGHGTLQAYVPQQPSIRVLGEGPPHPISMTALLFPKTTLSLVSSNVTVQGVIMPGQAIQPGIVHFGAGSGGGWLGSFSGPLVVKVTDQLDRPAAGVPVTFSCPSATAQPLWTLCQFSTSTVTSGSDGLASVQKSGSTPALMIDIPAAGNLSNTGTAGPFTYAITASSPNSASVTMRVTVTTKF